VNYDIVYADPPWFYTANSTAKLPYKSMTVPELCEFPIGELLAPKGILFVWVTCPLLMGQQATVTEEWCERYGLHYRGMPFIWIKTKRDGTPLKAQGVRATITKPNVEFVLAFSRVIRGRPIKIADEKICQTVFAPKTEHSEKPAEVRSRIDGLYPSASKVELFHRGVSPQGWDTWGNEAETPISWDPLDY
jgi:N6-adenosine-specific RNA methylase IME4